MTDKNNVTEIERTPAVYIDSEGECWAVVSIMLRDNPTRDKALAILRGRGVTHFLPLDEYHDPEIMEALIPVGYVAIEALSSGFFVRPMRESEWHDGSHAINTDAR